MLSPAYLIPSLIKMADVPNAWNKSPVPLGAHISCTTTHRDVFRGNVIATDETNGSIVIKSINPSSTTPQQSTRSTLSSGDVHVINLRHVSNLSIIPQPQQNGITTDPSALPRIDVDKVKQRIRKNVADRRREINSRGVNVSQEAQQLFDVLRKLYNDIVWDRDVIVIMNDVRVSPPYTSDSCTGTPQLTGMIKKQVTKFNETNSTSKISTSEDPAKL